MRKVLFLMFLLLLMGLGAAGVKAQVRIGGNGAPNASAVLDLNATDATTGTKGLALPRVNLTSATMQLTTGVANLTGMMVYNTTATLGAIGIYYWNGATWVLASLPSVITADSGRILRFNGSVPYWGTLSAAADTAVRSATLLPTFLTPAWQEIADFTVTYAGMAGRFLNVSVPGMRTTDLCYNAGDNNWMFVSSGPNVVTIEDWSQTPQAYRGTRVICFRPFP